MSENGRNGGVQDCPPPPVLRVTQYSELGKNLWGGMDSYSHPPPPGRTQGGGLLRLPHVQAVTRSHTGQTAPHGHASATLGQCGRMARTRPRQAIHGARHGHARPGQGEAPAGIMAQRKAPPVRAGLG